MSAANTPSTDFDQWETQLDIIDRDDSDSGDMSDLTPWRDVDHWHILSYDEQRSACDRYVQQKVNEHLIDMERHHFWSDKRQMGYIGHDPERDAIADELGSIELHYLLVKNDPSVLDHSALFGTMVGELGSPNSKAEYFFMGYQTEDFLKSASEAVDAFMNERGWKSDSMAQVVARLEAVNERIIHYGNKLLRRADAKFNDKQLERLCEILQTQDQLRQNADQMETSLKSTKFESIKDRFAAEDQLKRCRDEIHYLQRELNHLTNPKIRKVLSKKRNLFDHGSEAYTSLRKMLDEQKDGIKHAVKEKVFRGELSLFPACWIAHMVDRAPIIETGDDYSYCIVSPHDYRKREEEGDSLRGIRCFAGHAGALGFNPTQLANQRGTVTHEVMHHVQNIRPMVYALEQLFAKKNLQGVLAQKEEYYGEECVVFHSDLFRNERRSRYAGRVYDSRLSTSRAMFDKSTEDNPMTFDKWCDHADRYGKRRFGKLELPDYGILEIGSQAAEDVYATTLTEDSPSSDPYPEASNEVRAWWVGLAAIV